MSYGALPDCVGSACRFYEFEVVEVQTETYRVRDPVTGERREENPPQEVQDAFREAIEKLYRAHGERHGGHDCGGACACARTDTLLSGPSLTATAQKHTHVFPGGGEVSGTYRLKTSVYEGICVPAQTRSGRLPPQDCDWRWYYDSYYYRGYRRHRRTWNYWASWQRC
jgi:hypothetical protein